MKPERGLEELYSDPLRADALLRSRRSFLMGAGLMGLQSVLRCSIPYLRFLPIGVAPLALAQNADPAGLDFGGLRVLNDRPLNVETPAHLLDDLVTPENRLFIRNNGLLPESVDPDTWTLQVSGESCLGPRGFSIAELKRSFTIHTYQLQIECGGNGRAEFRPRVPGNQWANGAVGAPLWTGVRLKDVLNACGIRGDAVYVGYLAADRHLSGDPNKRPISRGVPMSKALEDESLIVFAMNGERLSVQHGAPLRLVCGGWPASVSGKWLTSLLVRDRVHDGEKMLGDSYRVPRHPVAPGASVDDSDMQIIESMPVRSVITYPQSGVEVAANAPVEIRGKAWAGDRSVSHVRVSIDFGQSWQNAELDPPPNRLAWQAWRAPVRLPLAGYYEIWALATDDAGVSQPMLVPGWNPKGYLNNATHRIALQAV